MPNVRPAVLDDVPAIAEIHVETWRAAYRGLLPDDFLASLSISDRRDMWDRVVSRGQATVLVATTETIGEMREDEKIVGFCSAGQPTDENQREDGTFELWTLYVSPDHWSSGAGRALWLAAESTLKALGADRVILWVLAGNERAIRFYRRAGFELDRSANKQLEVQGATREELLMVKTLGERSPTAVIADIHGNLTALETVVEDMRGLGVRDVICLGDVAAMGPEPRATVELLRSLAPKTVLGNTDDYLLNPRSLEQFPDATASNRFHLETEWWGAEQLGAENLDWLRSFAPSLSFELHGCRIIAYHGSPLSYDDHTGPTTPEATLARYFEGLDADLYLGAHIHLQFSRRYRRAVVANPGSVGMAFDRLDGVVEQPAVAEYALLDIVGGEPNLRLRRVPYDKSRLVAAVRASGMPHPERYLENLR